MSLTHGSVKYKKKTFRSYVELKNLYSGLVVVLLQEKWEVMVKNIRKRM